MQELILKAELPSITAASAFMEEQTEAMGLSMKGQMQLNIVIDELLGNIINYAYPEGDGDAIFRLEEDNGYVRITFIDHGIPYNPLAKEDPDITLSAEERRIGGLGIFMAKKLTDRMEYRYEDGRNILTVWKKI